MGSDSSKPEAKEASWNRKKFVRESASNGSLFREAGGNERQEDWIEAVQFSNYNCGGFNT